MLGPFAEEALDALPRAAPERQLPGVVVPALLPPPEGSIRRRPPTTGSTPLRRGRGSVVRSGIELRKECLPCGGDRMWRRPPGRRGRRRGCLPAQLPCHEVAHQVLGARERGSLAGYPERDPAQGQDAGSLSNASGSPRSAPRRAAPAPLVEHRHRGRVVRLVHADGRGQVPVGWGGPHGDDVAEAREVHGGRRACQRPQVYDEGVGPARGTVRLVPLLRSTETSSENALTEAAVCTTTSGGPSTVASLQTSVTVPEPTTTTQSAPHGVLASQPFVRVKLGSSPLPEHHRRTSNVARADARPHPWVTIIAPHRRGVHNEHDARRFVASTGNSETTSARGSGVASDLDPAHAYGGELPRGRRALGPRAGRRGRWGLPRLVGLLP